MQNSDPSSPDGITTMVALERPALPNPERLVSRLSEQIGFLGDADYTANETNFILPTVDGTVFISLFDFPYPRDEWADLAARNWQWSAAAEAGPRQNAHLVIHSSFPADPPLKAHLKQAAIVDEILNQLPAVGVVWASALNSPENFRRSFATSKDGGGPPSLSWILYQMSSTPKGSTVISTLGLNRMGLMEIEGNPIPLPADKALFLANAVAVLLMKSGPVIGDGDTVDGADGRPVRVRHAPSFRDGVGTVYRLDFGLPPYEGGEPRSAKRSVFRRLFGRQ